MTATLALSLVIRLDGIGARVMTPKDVPPTVDIPVVVVVWVYNTQVVSAMNAIRANMPPVSNATLRDEALSVAFPQPCWPPHVRSSRNGEGP